MAEVLRTEGQTGRWLRASVEQRQIFGTGQDQEDLQLLAHETSSAVQGVYERRERAKIVAVSWAGSEPRPDTESQTMWADQTFRELMGFQPTDKPTAVHLNKLVGVSGTVFDFTNPTESHHA